MQLWGLLAREVRYFLISFIFFVFVLLFAILSSFLLLFFFFSAFFIFFLFFLILTFLSLLETRLAISLGKTLNLPVYHEKVENNELLEKFYQDPGTYALPLQFALLYDRFKQQQEIQIISKGKAIQDRSIYEDSIFLDLLIEEGKIIPEGKEIYLNLFSILKPSILPPNLLIFLHVSAETAMKRIEERGRPMEKGITLEYLQVLEKKYDEYISEVSKYISVIKIDWTNYQNVDSVAEAIVAHWHQLSNIVSISEKDLLE